MKKFVRNYERNFTGGTNARKTGILIEDWPLSWDFLILFRERVRSLHVILFKIPREKDTELTVFWVNHEIVPNGLDKRNYEGEIFPLKSLDFYVVTK